MISRKVHSEQEKYDVCKSSTVKMNRTGKILWFTMCSDLEVTNM